MTAVEFYAEQEIQLTLDFISKKISDAEYCIKRIKLIEQAKAMEKEQIIEARQSGINATINGKSISNIDYYNETFKSE